MDPEEFDRNVKELELRIDRLRALYEQYFLGIERLEPAIARKDVDRRFWQLKRIKVRNTARRFRFQTLVQRYNTLQQHWGRVCRQIENGTYKRQIARARRREKDIQKPPDGLEPPRETIPPSSSRTAPAIAQTEMDLGAMLAAEMDADQEMRSAVEAAFDALGPKDDSRRPSQAPGKEASTVALEGTRGNRAQAAKRPRRQKAPVAASENNATPTRGKSGPEDTAKAPRPKPRRLPRAAATADGSGLSDERISRIYRDLVDARSSVNQVGTVNPQRLAQSLKRTEAQIRKSHGDRKVDFKIEVRNGKAQVKPILR